MDGPDLVRLVASLIVERPLCVPCIAHKSAATELETLRAIERIALTVTVTSQEGERCRACGATVEPVYWISAPPA
jgi:hypothetical protein